MIKIHNSYFSDSKTLNLNTKGKTSDVGYFLFFFFYFYLERFLLDFFLDSMNQIPQLLLLLLDSLDLLPNTAPHGVVLFLATLETFNDKKKYSIMRLRF